MARLVQKWLSVITGIWLLVVLQRYWARQGTLRMRRSAEVPTPLDGPRWHGNESIVVAGAAGFLGMHLVEALQKANVQLMAVDHVTFVDAERESLRRKRTSHLDKRWHVQMRKANICNKESLRGFLEKSNATHLLYVAIDESDAFTIGDHVRRHLSCVQAAVDAAVAMGTHLTVVTTNALGSTEESSNLRRAMTQAGEGLLWAAHQEHGLRASLVQIDAEMFGPWEHPDMTASTWYYAMQQHAAVLSEVSGKGMLYVGDVAREVANMVAESEHWDRWAIDQHTFEYDTIYSYLLHKVTNSTQTQPLLPPPVMTEASTRHTHPREVGKGQMALRRLKDPQRTTLDDAMRPFLKWMQTNTDTLAEVSIKVDTYFREWVKREQERKDAYQEAAKNKWLQFAKAMNIKMPYSDGPHTYTFYQGKYSLGQPINVVAIYEDTVEEMRQACDEEMYCIGFSTDGLMLARIMPHANWDTKPYKAKDSYGPADGLYVADDVDLCSHPSLHKCPGEAKCIFEGAGRYRCECKEGLELTSDNRCEPKRRRMDTLPAFMRQHDIGRLLMQKMAGLKLDLGRNEVEEEKKEVVGARGVLAQIGMVNDEKKEGEVKEKSEEEEDGGDDGELAVVEEEKVERKEDELKEEVVINEDNDGKEEGKEVDTADEAGSEDMVGGEQTGKDSIESSNEGNEAAGEEAQDRMDGEKEGEKENIEVESKEENDNVQGDDDVIIPVVAQGKVEREEEREEIIEVESTGDEEKVVYGPRLDNTEGRLEGEVKDKKDESERVNAQEIVSAPVEDVTKKDIEPPGVVEGNVEREEDNEDGGVENVSEEKAVNALDPVIDLEGNKSEETDENEDEVGVEIAEVVRQEEGSMKGVRAPEGGWVDLVMCTDAAQAKGVAVVIKSALDHMKQPERLRVHVVTGRQDAPGLARNLGCYGFDVAPLDGSATDGYQVNVVPFDEDSVKGMYRVHTSTAVTGNLGSALNFARFYLASLLPAVSRAVYLDVDTVVQGDLGLLCAEAYSQMDANPNMLLAVAQRLPNRPMSKQVHKVYYERYGKDFNERDMVQYNAGVFVVDLARWREQRLTEEAEFWMRETTRQKLWDYGSQPVMYMCCHGRTLTLDWRWNVDGLGWNTLPANRIAEARILHWSGKSKPWDEDPPNKYRDLWIRHMPDFTCQVEAGKA
eukprot:comp23993_c0_seq2/m.42661 comp23993_c0_seq2/g.42661  ORF comp23993_c0_seq2/g.42661 comp23993_c0_seq2/m.42661 type:complete len:1173 (-) comp23993_c0_seq2:222-3740(-)